MKTRRLSYLAMSVSVTLLTPVYGASSGGGHGGGGGGGHGGGFAHSGGGGGGSFAHSGGGAAFRGPSGAGPSMAGRSAGGVAFHGPAAIPGGRSYYGGTPGAVPRVSGGPVVQGRAGTSVYRGSSPRVNTFAFGSSGRYGGQWHHNGGQWHHDGDRWHHDGDHHHGGRRVAFVGGGFYPYYYSYPYYNDYYGYNDYNDYPYYSAQVDVQPAYYGTEVGLTGSRAVVAAVQRELQRAGYYRGPVDGIIGPVTRGAIVAYERDNRLPAVAGINRPLLSSLGLI